MGYRPWGLKESDTTEQLNTLNSAGLSNAGLLFTDDSSDFYMVTAPAFRSVHSHSNPVKWTLSSSPLCVCVCVCVCVCLCKVTESCLTLCNPMDCGPPGSSVCGIFFQARILQWVAVSFSGGSSQPRD